MVAQLAAHPGVGVEIATGAVVAAATVVVVAVVVTVKLLSVPVDVIVGGVVDGVDAIDGAGVDTVGQAASTVVSQIPHSPSVS